MVGRPLAPLRDRLPGALVVALVALIHRFLAIDTHEEVFALVWAEAALPITEALGAVGAQEGDDPGLEDVIVLFQLSVI